MEEGFGRILQSIMGNFCNLLSVSRLGFALVFAYSQLPLRLAAVMGAMASDFLDGYLARRYQAATKIGSILDPLMDKLFVVISVTVLYLEGTLSAPQLIVMLSRDFALCVFGAYLSFKRGWRGYDCRAMLWGKVFTLLQFVVLLGVTLFGPVLPMFCFLPFFILVFPAFFERLLGYKRSLVRSE
ncbi:CDP-alcohol phosphatidyltransferase family protein [Chlamydiifrater phoenicopteri]|uniref:CDP-alcohol phosphatidyltransferase family protein n=1 Tax=Chlamydiifrater phoenicopteri TaxID=2681469 RepID=UPI001FEAF828|nr:CDP-alcohol phosphatidyltransferase family protein [Chlamydiifrater phoenicopteri]